MQNEFALPQSEIRESRSFLARTRAGRLSPVGMVGVGPHESGLLHQEVTITLDPIMGKIVTPITGRMTAVMVPLEAMDALKNPTDPFAGHTGVIETKLANNTFFLGWSGETDISKNAGINPILIGANKVVCENVHLSHNCAVNHLRRRVYHKATTILAANTSITPSIFSMTMVDQFNGALDPDDHINGRVNLELPTMNLPMKGLGRATGATPAAGVNVAVKETGGASVTYAKTDYIGDDAASRYVYMRTDAAGTAPDVYAFLNGVSAGSVNLTDFYKAEEMDRLTRRISQIIEDNPQHGADIVLRWASALDVNFSKECVVLAEREGVFGQSLEVASDSAGINGDLMRSDSALRLGFDVVVPKTKLGGVIVTFVEVLPDEAVPDQPHPFFTRLYTKENYAADSMNKDPVPVLKRELWSDLPQAEQEQVAFYTGLNELRATYTQWGLNRRLDPNSVDNRTMLWQVKRPMAKTPDSIIYPAVLPQYPFADQNAEVASMVFHTSHMFRSPMQRGPSPVETVDGLISNDVFEEA